MRVCVRVYACIAGFKRSNLCNIEARSERDEINMWAHLAKDVSEEGSVGLIVIFYDQFWKQIIECNQLETRFFPFK